MEIDPQFTPLDAVQPSLMGSNLSESVAEARQIIEDARSTYPHVAVIALFSGGNDSTTLLHLVKDQIDFALHINTGIGIELTREFVRDTCSTWGVRLEERFTDPAWYRADVVKHGFPSPVQHRVMYHNLKRERLREVRRSLCQRGEKLLLLTGERAYESQRRMGHGSATARIDDGCIWVNPIHFFTDWHMFRYRQSFTVPRNPVSDRLHRSGECLCGAMAKREELHDIDIWFPKTANYIHELERQAAEAGHGKRSEWAWATEHRNPDMPAPGPMCSSCHRFEQTEMEIPA